MIKWRWFARPPAGLPPACARAHRSGTYKRRAGSRGRVPGAATCSRRPSVPPPYPPNLSPPFGATGCIHDLRTRDPRRAGSSLYRLVTSGRGPSSHHGDRGPSCSPGGGGRRRHHRHRRSLPYHRHPPLPGRRLPRGDCFCRHETHGCNVHKLSSVYTLLAPFCTTLMHPGSNLAVCLVLVPSQDFSGHIRVFSPSRKGFR